MVKPCDHTSVGLIVPNPQGQILLIKRAKPPYGYACPAGHVDDHGGWQQAALAELEEEVGLRARQIDLLHVGRYENPCRRPGGAWHNWRVYFIVAEGFDVIASENETCGFLWAGPRKLHELARRTARRRAGDIPDEAWQADPGLEDIWVTLLRRLDYLKATT